MRPEPVDLSDEEWEDYALSLIANAYQLRTRYGIG
jgi:hypothetical protein